VGLSIATSSSNLVVSWAASAPGYVLEGSSSPGSWTVVNTPPLTNGLVISVTIPLPGAPQFFRLIHP